MHVDGGDEESWMIRGRANFILDNLIASGKAVLMIVVITNGNPDVMASPLNRTLEELHTDPAGVKGIGKKDFLFDTVTELRGIYDSRSFPYEYRKRDGAHNWNERRFTSPKLFPNSSSKY